MTAPAFASNQQLTGGRRGPVVMDARMAGRQLLGRRPAARGCHHNYKYIAAGLARPTFRQPSNPPLLTTRTRSLSRGIWVSGSWCTGWCSWPSPAPCSWPSISTWRRCSTSPPPAAAASRSASAAVDTGPSIGWTDGRSCSRRGGMD
jgi:hypothetical protein